MENGECSALAAVELITVHDFCEKILEQQVHFHVMKLSGGFFLWIGSNPVLSNLAVSIDSKYVNAWMSNEISDYYIHVPWCTPRYLGAYKDSVPLCTLVLGDTSDTTPNTLAQRLTKKTKKQVFVSYNLPVTDSNLLLLVENRIKQEMELHPDKF
ncbi:proteasome assembly chaperone 4 isoform X1 [Myxocyprinus asiaticus]|uniref:proteasome assembly chaperone 4 isoform X1 n=1 Tax=Myxocyprinus asiaticus TaxID=70543 RepID=UPI0022228600|nr:proteasome assembly chaperone 4 isoform X1 [Myxocyprinus asiaticus]